MSHTLYLEPVGGISGDMFLAAVADLGVDLQEVERLLHGVGVHGFEIHTERGVEHAIQGTRITVKLGGADSGGEGHTQRDWKEILALLQRLPQPIAKRAIAAFGRLAEVEARIHGVAIPDVHFHELGAVDSIVDIVGGAYAIEALGAEKIATSPPPLGSGITTSQHGTLPIPAPATLALLKDLPVLLEGKGEMTTPTGAAILSSWATFEPPRRFIVSRIGYGLGHARWEDRPNILRASLGEASEVGVLSRRVGLLEANLDDASPQLLAYLVERLMEGGALDAGLTPLLMKKGRPGQRLTVVCELDQRAKLTEYILRESSTLGVRFTVVERDELSREIVTVETELGPVRVKIARLGDEVVNLSPEYEDCAALARRLDVSLKRVLSAATAAAHQLWTAKRS
jgi:uncharacterized protein (TIGR00299 family) protein